MGEDKTAVTATDVEVFLMKNPDFFLQHPLALESLEFNMSPEGTISLAKKQHERLQDKNHQLQEQLQALIENAHSNTALQGKVHQLCLQLMDAGSLPELLDTLHQQIIAEFAADDVALRLFYCADHKLDLPADGHNVKQVHPDDDSLKHFDNLMTKQQPVCGRLTKKQKALLFEDKAELIQSMVCLPLGHEPCAGLLAIGSQDANRFHADMATDYLSFLGEVLMRILRQFCHPAHD